MQRLDENDSRRSVSGSWKLLGLRDEGVGVPFYLNGEMWKGSRIVERPASYVIDGSCDKKRYIRSYFALENTKAWDSSWQSYQVGLKCYNLDRCRLDSPLLWYLGGFNPHSLNLPNPVIPPKDL